MSNRKLLVFFLFTIVILLLRDAPYINVLILNKLWIVYILLIILTISFFIPRKESYLPVTLFLLPFIALIFNLVRIAIGAEVIGVIFYSILWFAVILKIISFVREKDNNNK